MTNSSLSVLDWSILLAYAILVVAIGVISGRTEKNTEDYFLGGRRMPWWAVLISIYATALSALTYIGVPGAAYNGDFLYLQLAFGDIVGRVLIAGLLLSAYYKQKVFTVYQLLAHRFGPRSRDTGSIFFILTRLLASGVRLAGCAIALAVVFDIPLNTAIVLIAFTALIYTLLGGIKAVIWTDMLQFLLFILAASVAIITILHALPNGWNDFIRIGNEYNKFKIFHLSFVRGTNDYWLNLGNPSSFIAGFLFGCFTTFAALGTDQDLVQRMLTCKKVRESQRALIGTAFLNIPITLMFLSVGAALFVYYKVFPDPEVARLVSIHRPDHIFPYFIKTAMAPGLRGLLIAGLLAAAMSSLDSALNALSSTATIDFYQNYIRTDASPETSLRVSRNFVIFFALILVGVAMKFAHTDSILWLGFRIIGYTYGAMLGIFLLAVLTRTRGCEWGNVFAMVSSVVVVIFLTAKSLGPLEALRSTILSPLNVQHIAWPWAIIIGTTWTFSVGAAFRGSPR